MWKPRVIGLGIAFLAFMFALWLATRSRHPQLSPRAILAQVQQLEELSTVRYTIQKVIGIKEPKRPIGSESILLVMQAHVQAGIDLSLLHADSVTIRPGREVLLHLPPAKILNVTVDEKETKVWDRQKTWWTPWVPYSLDLEHRARKAGVEAVKQAALEMGILAQADRNAEASIRSFLTLAGVKSVTIVRGNVSKYRRISGDKEIWVSSWCVVST